MGPGSKGDPDSQVKPYHDYRSNNGLRKWVDIETRDINRHITHTAIILPHISLLAAGAVLLSSAGNLNSFPLPQFPCKCADRLLLCWGTGTFQEKCANPGGVLLHCNNHLLCCVFEPCLKNGFGGCNQGNIRLEMQIRICVVNTA